MGQRFSIWNGVANDRPSSLGELVSIIRGNRSFVEADRLEYGDYGLNDTIATVSRAIRENKRIALYADYDVDGTMSAVSWIWFLKGIGFQNFLHYIPCRFKEGYGVNLNAIKHLIDVEKAELIITMDTGITANEEAVYCRQRGVEFICTDHHKIQKEKMPDCIILNPKMHPDPAYQELCGCGITFVLLRKLAEQFPVAQELWTDLLALAGMATICDVVPLNHINHKLARMGVAALIRSRRPVFVKLRQAAAMYEGGDEKDVSFRIGPRINAVGRLEHADKVIHAFASEDATELVKYMGECNDKRKIIQQKIIREAMIQAELSKRDDVLFLGGDWHPGVVGIAASKITERFWRPTWLFHKGEGICKGSARSIAGFDVTEAMTYCKERFLKFGGHRAAGGFAFETEEEHEIRQGLKMYAAGVRRENPELWESKISYDCELSTQLCELELAYSLDELKPFGHGFEEPRFLLKGVISKTKFFNDKQTGEKKHTAIFLDRKGALPQKVMFFNEVLPEFSRGASVDFLVTASKNTFNGTTSLELYGCDWHVAG